MLTRLFKTRSTVMAAMPPAPTADVLRRACDAIMHSHEPLDAATRRISSLRRGAATEPPAAATVELVFRREYPTGFAVEIPRGTRVSTNDEPHARVTFMTGRSARIEPGEDEVRVLAYHAEFIGGELLGFTTGVARSLSVARVPLVEATTADLELMIGVACDATELGNGERALLFDGRPFRVWTEMGSAWTARTGGRIFIADRLTGDIALLPQARAKVEDDRLVAPPPAPRREIRAWYWRGGGAAGNVEAHALCVLRDSLRSVVVTNPVAARGGRDADAFVTPVTLDRLSRVAAG